MPKYTNPKQVVGASAPSQKDPREGSKGATGMWWGDKHYPGYYITYTYADGTKETRFFYEGSSPDTGSTGVYVQSEGTDAEQAKDYLDDQQGSKPTTPQTPGQKAADDARVLQEQRDENERRWNADPENPRGSGLTETHAERAKREAAELQRQRDEDRDAYNRRQEERQKAQDQARLDQDKRDYDLNVRKFEADQAKPSFLSQAGEDNPYLVRYDPKTGTTVSEKNPNFDAVKQQAERLRQQLAVQVQARSVTLDEAKQQYTQWYDSNVKIPMLQAQEARDRAAEQRQALDAEERRRQFAANFGLQKQELGQKASQMMISAEESLLPYRAGPTEAAEMSSAINSLAQGGSMDKNASAGINFTPGAFQFAAPDFKKIAADAAKTALSGLTDYKPAEGSYSTADYSNVPAVNAGGAPAIPTGYGAFQDIVDQMKTPYQYGGQ